MPYTVLGIFDDSIDAEQVLIALRRAQRPAEQVSVLVRDRAAEHQGRLSAHGEVARALVANALSAVGGWLLGLAALVLPDHGPMLVAGPIGAALGRAQPLPARGPHPNETQAADPSGSEPDGLHRTLAEFGFAADEASYIANRLGAGSIVVAVTIYDDEQLQPMRQLFADYNAVHIGQSQTGEEIASAAAELLFRLPQEPHESAVVIADAVTIYRHLCQEPEPVALAAGMCDTPVLDTNGEEAGELEDLLAVNGDDDSPTLCYAVIGFGGVLGLGRHRVAVPAELVDLGEQPPRLLVPREVLRQAPPYDPDIPLSRQEEHAIHAFFGTRPS
jgi:hypothetical protein